MDLDLEQLMAAVPGESAAAIASAWDAELDRREAELAEDPGLGIPAAEVFRLLEADLAARRAASGETVR
jgi:hypothetical protein